MSPQLQTRICYFLVLILALLQEVQCNALRTQEPQTLPSNPTEVIPAPSVYGTILLPSIGVRLPGTNQFLIHLKGRYSSDVHNQVIRNIINQTGMALLPTTTDAWMNMKLRAAYFLTLVRDKEDRAIKYTSFEFRTVNGTLIRDTRNNAFTPCSNATVELDGTFSCLTTIPYHFTNDATLAESVSDTLSTNNYSLYFNPANTKIKQTVLLTEQEGYAIISDIDDTVKVTGVNSVKQVFKNSLMRQFHPTPGMPEYYWSLYQGLVIPQPPPSTTMEDPQISIRPTFHFLSATPMQFIPAIQPFLLQYYPPFELIVSTLAVASGGLKTVKQYREFKVNSTHRIGTILDRKKYILIGDSTQKDPEAYGDIAREYGDRVVCIFIRIVWGFNEKLERETLNTADRFQVAFANVSRSKWMIFAHPDELPTPDQIKTGNCNPFGGVDIPILVPASASAQ